ncbi:MAG: hypothetical protein JW863_03030 [Chitinispirillaceae bacterium]|nr:hypothetical protein [Chitinispirillaceae bacterium]
MKRGIIAGAWGIIVLTGLLSAAFAAENKDVTKMIFEERRIEGKIRRPQLVLIKAEQRPEFDPMVLQSLGRTGDIAGAVDKSILEASPYDGAFQFRGTRIDNYVP